MTELHDILDARTKRLEGNYSYKLAGPMMYGMDVAIADESEPNESEMSFWLPYADGNNRDGVGDLLEIGGIELDRHRDNAINLFDHGKHLVLPIGMTWARNEKGEYDRNQYVSEIDVVSQRARDKVFVWQGRDDGMLGKDIPGLKEHAITCEQYFHMVCKKMLGCGSIGYQIIDGAEIPPDYSRGIPKGVHLRRVKKLESSLVVMPANQNTAPKHKGFEWVREVLAMPRMCGKPLSPMFVKSFSDYCPEQTKTVVGFADVVETKGVKSSGDTVSRIQKVCESFSDVMDRGPDYQNCFYNSIFNQIWWESFDGDSEEAVREIEKRLAAIPDIKKVTVESECTPPRGEGWEQVWHSDKKTSKEWKSLKVPIPHDDLNDSKIPPAKWKPGVGAIKRNPKPTSINVFQPGQTVTARKILTWTDKATGRVDTFARTGDRLEVISVTGDGALATVRRPDGKQIQVTGASIRRSKGMPESKSLDEIRKRYKQLRLARARKHAPKSFKFLVTCKHEGKSGQFEVVATSMKDAAEIAKKCSKDKCGMPPSSIKAVKQAGQIKMKSLEIKGKAMEDEEVDLETSPETDETPDQDDWSGEPFGSQVLRRLHQDKSHLMKEYDGFMNLLDHEPTKGHLGSHMEYMEKFLGDTEKLHGKHYKHLNPIGGKTKDLTEEEAEDIGDELETQTEDTEEEPAETEGEETAEEEVGGASENETVESDSSESDAPTPDEALDGMDKKDKKGKSLKVKRKAHACEQGERADRGECTPKDPKKKKSMCPECGKEGCSCNGSAKTKSSNKWGLQDHEMKSAGEANDFMGELSSTQDFSDEHRMKSYHYHKTLDGIGQMGQVNEDLNQDPSIKSDPGSDQWQQEEIEEPEHQGNEFQKMCKDMSGWYKQLSQTRDFGDPHRKRCGMLHKAMSDMMGGAETEEVTEDDLGGTLEEDIPGDLGGMDEKALLNYEKAAIERSKQIAALAKQVAAIRL